MRIASWIVLIALFPVPLLFSQTPRINDSVITVGSGFNHPYGVAVDRSGDVFVADTCNSGVKEIVAGTGGAAIGTISAGSTVNEIGRGFLVPFGVAVDLKGNLFVAESRGTSVKEILAKTVGATVGDVKQIGGDVTRPIVINQPEPKYTVEDANEQRKKPSPAMQNTGVITGTVTDSSGASVPNAQVTATNAETGVMVTRQTTRDGVYAISQLPSGDYIIEVIAIGVQRLLHQNYQNINYQNIKLDFGQKVRLDLKLKPEDESKPITPPNDVSK